MISKRVLPCRNYAFSLAKVCYLLNLRSEFHSNRQLVVGPLLTTQLSFVEKYTDSSVGFKGTRVDSIFWRSSTSASTPGQELFTKGVPPQLQICKMPTQFSFCLLPSPTSGYRIATCSLLRAINVDILQYVRPRPE